jgi:hypothetical protein
MKSLLAVISMTLLLSCQSATQADPAVPITILGATDYGKVILGDQFESVVVLNNSDNDVEAEASQAFEPPFYLVSFQPATCSSKLVPAKTACYYKIRFSPSDSGVFKSDILFKGLSATLTGQGIKPGFAVITPASFNVGTLNAGAIRQYDVTLSNTGDSDLQYPKIKLPSELTVLSTTCGTSVKPKAQCLITLQFSPKLRSSTFFKAVTFDDVASVSFLGTIQAGPSSGSIALSLLPANVDLSIARSNEIVVSTGLIRDAFGNTVEDGTAVEASVLNLKLMEDTTDFKKVVLYTVNGVVQFRIQAGTQAGQGNFSVKTDTSIGSGFVNVIN